MSGQRTQRINTHQQTERDQTGSQIVSHANEIVTRFGIVKHGTVWCDWAWLQQTAFKFDSNTDSGSVSSSGSGVREIAAREHYLRHDVLWRAIVIGPELWADEAKTGWWDGIGNGSGNGVGVGVGVGVVVVVVVVGMGVMSVGVGCGVVGRVSAI
jgi:hypothetical protein